MNKEMQPKYIPIKYFNRSYKNLFFVGDALSITIKNIKYQKYLSLILVWRLKMGGGGEKVEGVLCPKGN